MSIHLRICLAVGAALAVARAGAAEATAVEGNPSPRESPRAVNGHVFQPSTLVTGPFSTTSFGMVTNFGIGEAEAPTYDINGNQTGTKSYPMASYGQGVNYHLRLWRDLGLRLDVHGLIFSGTDGRGILVAGATAQYGFTAGLTWGWNLGSTARLSVLANLGTEPQMSVLVGSAVLRALQTRSFDDAGLFSTVTRLRASPGLSFAWAPSPVLGFVGEARYVWTRRVSKGGAEDGSRTAQGASLGGIASLDLNPLIRWPIAFQGSFRSDFPVSGHGISEVHQVGGGVYYSGRVNLALGLEANWRHGKIRPGVTPSLNSDSTTAAIVFRYYW